MLVVLDELESLKPEFQRRVDVVSNSHAKAQLPEDNGFKKPLDTPLTSALEWPAVNKSSYMSTDYKQVRNVLSILMQLEVIACV